MNLQRSKFLSFLWGVSVFGIGNMTKHYNINFLFAFFGLLTCTLLLLSIAFIVVFAESLYGVLPVSVFIIIKVIAYIKLNINI